MPVQKKKYANGDVYEGEFLNDQRHGKGIFKDNNGDVYEGDFLNDKIQGKGVYTYKEGDVYEGDFINNCFDENFYTFINRYRLEDCKAMLVNEKYNHLSILGIAFEAGFNSKTAFNTAFKKNTGLSPKEFKENFFVK